MRKYLHLFFGEFNVRWLIRAYMIGLLMFCFTVGPFLFNSVSESVSEAQNTQLPLMIVWGIFNLALFPFAKIVWDSARDFVLGDTAITSAVIILFLMKFAVNFALFTGALFVAPIGMIFLFFRRRNRLNNTHTGEQS